jgi:hypothetical protein
MTPRPVQQTVHSGERPDAHERSDGQSLLAACSKKAPTVAQGLCPRNGLGSLRRRTPDSLAQRLRPSPREPIIGISVLSWSMVPVARGHRT